MGIPNIESASDLPKAITVLLEAPGRGELTPGEARRLAALFGEAGKALEILDIERRPRKLEGQRIS